MIRFLRIFLVSVAAIFLLSGCRHDDEPRRVHRTILVYMASKNNLSNYATLDLGEMLNAEIPRNCRLLVFRSTYGVEPQLIEVENGRQTILKTYEAGTIAADKETLIQVLADVEELAPSKSPGIIFWSHSSGWKGAQRVAAASRTFGQEQGREIELPDLAKALLTASRKPAFIMFDSCYMGCVEVAYELRNCADYLVASVCEVPTDGMPYDQTLPSLFAGDLAGAIDINVDYYLAQPMEKCPSTFAVIDLKAMDNLARASTEIYGNRKAPEEDFQRFSVNTPYKDLFVDFKHFMEQTSAGPVDEFNRALEQAVVHERHTASIWDRLAIEHCCGLSVNPEPESSNYNYRNLSWYKDVISTDGRVEN